MYDSLLKHSSEFHLYVFAFDNECFEYLKKQKLVHLTVISLAEFEDDELLKVKSSRTQSEYCWTCTPSIILYSIIKFKLQHCTYVDADLLFFSNPAVLINEMNEKSVLITEHRYTKEYDLSNLSGIYCVQFVTFKNNEMGLEVLKYWKVKCIEWCFNRFEDGKFGDQMYLNDWSSRFKEVHVLKHLGGGIAPWNVQQYKFLYDKNKLIGIDKNNIIFDVVFYHYHDLKFYNNIVSLTNSMYYINKEVQDIFYKTYVNLLDKKRKLIENTDKNINPNGNLTNKPYNKLKIKTIIRYYLIDIRGSFKNIFLKNMKKNIKNHHYYEIENFIKNII